MSQTPAKPQRGPFPVGTCVAINVGGPLMTVEDVRNDGLVATVWFADGVLHRDVFDVESLNAWVPRDPPCG